MIRFKINKKEPLRAELDAFIAAVRANGAAPVRGEDGLLALAVARKLVEAGAAGTTLPLDEGHGFTWPPMALRVPASELLAVEVGQSAAATASNGEHE
jgi:hypothetical protein